MKMLRVTALSLILLLAACGTAHNDAYWGGVAVGVGQTINPK